MHILSSINCDKMCFLCLSHNTYCVWGKPLEFYEAIWTACKTAEGKTSWIFNNRVKQSMWCFHWQLSLFHIKMGSVFQMWNKNQTIMICTLFVWKAWSPRLFTGSTFMWFLKQKNEPNPSKKQSSGKVCLTHKKVKWKRLFSCSSTCKLVVAEPLY